MEKSKDFKPGPAGMDPAAINAAFFEIYKSNCDCTPCQILRAELEKSVKGYLPKKVK